MLEARNIHKSYGALQVLRGVNLRLTEGKIITLVGSSGAGKSTLLQIMGTLDNPDQGSVFFNGEEISLKGDKAQSEFRNKHLGFVFQFHHLLPEFTAIENVCLPAWIAGRPKGETLTQARELLGYLGLGDRVTHKPSELSGGEQQRIAVARALINRPEYILADEPTGNLDSANGEILFELMTGLARDFQVAFLITTHNEALAKRGDEQYRIVDGVIGG